MIRLRYLLPLIALLSLAPFIIQAKEPIRNEEGVVKHVADGDTVSVVTNEGAKLKVRLYGIDAPETQHMNKKQGLYQSPASRMVRKPTELWKARFLGRRVKVHIMDIDRYRRMVALSILAIETSTAKWSKRAMHGHIKNT